MSLSRKQFLKNTGLASLAIGGFSTSGCEKVKPSEAIIPHILPGSITWNSTIGLVAPASPIYDSSEFERMLTSLKLLGFNLKLGKHVRTQIGYLAGTDEDRAADLMNMFKDDDVEAIICIRGGWGCNRILNLLDYEVIKNNPKPLIGFSDITSLHNALLKKSGLTTFHGPVGKSEWNKFTKQSFESVLIEKELATYELPNSEEDAFTISPGTSEGMLLGGNLSVLVSMIGSEYLPSFENSILFMEDVGESVYRIDRMLTQLKLSGILDQLSGFIFGKCTDCDAGTNSLSLAQVFEHHIKPLNIPAFYGAMISHEDLNVTIPVGIRGRMDASNKSFQILSQAVK